MAAPTNIIWHQDRSPDGRRSDRWFVSKRDMPACGGVWRERGRYRVEAWPAGSKAPPGAYYATRATAQRHLERWLGAHPRVLELESKGWRGVKSKPAPLPDWRIAQYLRLAKNGPSVGKLRGATVNDRTAQSSFFTKTELAGRDRCS